MVPALKRSVTGGRWVEDVEVKTSRGYKWKAHRVKKVSSPGRATTAAVGNVPAAAGVHLIAEKMTPTSQRVSSVIVSPGYLRGYFAVAE